MEKKKVAFFLIKALSDIDRGAFRQKIKCGKTAKNAERHEKLFSYLEKAVNVDDIDEINSTKLAKALKLSSSKKLTPLYGELIDDIKRYLVTSQLQEEELLQELLLQKALCKREEAEYIEVLHQNIRERISAQTKMPPNPQEYQQYASFYKNLYSHPNTNTRKDEALGYLNLSEANLDTSYWISKLRLLIEKANRGIVLAHEKYLLQELPVLPDLTPYTHNDSSHILSIYSRVYQFALAPFQQEDLQAVLTLITDHSPTIPKEDKERIFNFLMGIIGYYMPSKETDLSVYNIYQVYKIGFINLWLVQDNGYMYFEDFINMLFLAFDAKDSELLETIDSDYEQYIPEGYHPFVSMLSRSYNFFLHGKWEAVLKSFSNQELPNKAHRLHFIVQRNIIEIKTLFQAFISDKIELGDIPSYLEKHHRFIQRKEAYSEQKKLRNFNFIKFLKRLYTYLTKRITFNFDKEEAQKEITKWLSDVEKTGDTIDQPWLKSIGETLLNEVSPTASQGNY